MEIPNEQQQKNLRTLSNYLFLGNLKAEFDMSVFSENMSQFSEHNEDGQGEKDCGSVGCAVGHGPYAGIPKKPEEDWIDYTKRAFGAKEEKIFDHLFGEEWEEYDNTPEGAGQRIHAFLYQLEKGTLTEEYLEVNTPF
jgi:hypothetical protein